MNMDETTCMCCGKLIADPSAPARFCSQDCFNSLLENVKANWNQRYREARANGNGSDNRPEIKPLSEIMQALVSAPKPMTRRSIKERSTYLDHAISNAEAEAEPGPTVIGVGVPQYPKPPTGPWSVPDPAGTEPVLGIDVNAVPDLGGRGLEAPAVPHARRLRRL